MKGRPHGKGRTNNNARLCLDYSNRDSFEAINILRKAGFNISADPIKGIPEPELTIGSRTYRGIASIRKVAEDVKLCSE